MIALDYKPKLWVCGVLIARIWTMSRRVPVVVGCFLVCLHWLIGCTEQTAQRDGMGAQVPALAEKEERALNVDVLAEDSDHVLPAEPTEPTEPAEVEEVIVLAVSPPPRPVRTSAEKLEGLPPKVPKPENKQHDLPALPAQAQQAVDEAGEFIKQGSLDMARSRLERALSFAPDDPSIHRLLGIVFYERDNTGKAREHFNKALRYRADDLEGHVLLGRAFDKENNSTRAARAYRTALMCSDAVPSNPLAGLALYRLADLLETSGQPENALDAFEVLSEWVDQYADAYARDSATEELALKPELLLIRRGGLLLKLRYIDEAVELLAKAHGRDSNNPDATRLLLDAYGASGEYDKGGEVLSDYSGHDVSSTIAEPIISGLIRGSVRDDHPREGLIWLGGLLGEHPEWSAAADLAIRDIVAKRVSQQFVESFLGEASSGGVGSRCAEHYLAGRLAEGVGLPLIAGEQFRLAVEADAMFIPAHDALICLAIEQGRYDVAMRAAERLVETDAPRWMVAYLRGKVMVALGEYERAIDVLREAQSLRKDYQPIQMVLADAYRSQGQFAQAASAIEEAIKIDPTTPGLFRKWLALESQSGTVMAFAANTVPRWAREHGGNLQFQLMQVELRLWTHDDDAALELLDDLLERYPNEVEVQLLAVYTRLWLARSEMVFPAAEKRMSPREAARREARQLAAEHQEMYYPRGYRYRTITLGESRIGDPPETAMQRWAQEAPPRALRQALVTLNDIRARWPGNRQGRLMTAEVLSALGENDQAMSLWQSLYIESPRDVEVLSGYVGALASADSHGRAAEVLKAALVVYPEDYAIRQSLISALMAAERYEDAVTHLKEWNDQAKAGSDEQWRYQIMLVKAYAGARMFDAGDELLTLMIQEAESQEIYGAPFEKEKFKLYMLAGRAKEGMELVKGNLREWMDVPGLLLPVREVREDGFGDASVLISIDVGDYSGGVEAARQDIRAWEDLPATEDTVIGMLLQMGYYDEAEKLLKEMVAATGPTDKRDMLRWKMLVVLFMSDRYEQGHALVDEWIGDKLEVSRSRCCLWKVIYYLLAGRQDDATAYCRQWIRRDNMSLEARQAAAFLLEEAKQYDELLGLLDEWDGEIAALDPLPKGPAGIRREMLVANLLNMRLGVLLELGRYVEVVERLEAALQDKPDDVWHLMQYSLALTEVNRPDDSIAALDKAIKILPDNPMLMNNLAYCLADRGIRLDEAKALILDSLRKAPTDNSVDTYGWVLYKKGEVAGAVRVFERLLNRLEDDDTENAVVWDHAGDAYYRGERAEEAVELWQKALELAEKDEHQSLAIRDILAKVPMKIESVAGGSVAPVAPLGEGVNDPLFPAEDTPQAEDDATEGESEVDVDDVTAVVTESSPSDASAAEDDAIEEPDPQPAE